MHNLNSCGQRIIVGMMCRVTCICLLWSCVLIIQADEHYVRPAGTCTNTELQFPYTSWDNAATNIQWAIDAAAFTETVWVTNGVYSVTTQVAITNNITLKSVNGWSNTLVYADWPSYTTRVFYVVNTGVLDGFTISNGHWWGNATLGGGGAFIASSSTVQNCYFTYNACSNTADVGGGGGAYTATAKVHNCYFVSNIIFKGLGGGGVFCQGTLITNSYFIMNHAANASAYGGGMYLQYARCTNRLWNCFIISNTVVGYAGGIYAENGGGTILNCTIACNRAGNSGGGGGIAWLVDMTDCVISNNYAGTGAGGIYANNSQTFKNCRILNNQSGGAGAGMGVSYGALTNCVIAGNSGAGGGGVSDNAVGFNTFYSCRIYNNLNTTGVGGGGMMLKGKNSSIRNCLISNNTNLNGYGGGVYISGSGTVVESCTVAGNYSTNDGGGLYLAGTNKYVVNTIIHVNSSLSNNNPDIYNTISENLDSFSNNCSSAALPVEQGNITTDPKFIGVDNWQLSGS